MREKHGKYSATTGLPDNNSQASGSGVYVWFLNEIRTLKIDADQLITEAAQHGANRYKWLCERLIDFGYKDVVDELKARQKIAASESRLKNKERTLQLLQKQLSETDNANRRTYLQKKITKVQSYIKLRKNKT